MGLGRVLVMKNEKNAPRALCSQVAKPFLSPGVFRPHLIVCVCVCWKVWPSAGIRMG